MVGSFFLKAALRGSIFKNIARSIGIGIPTAAIVAPETTFSVIGNGLSRVFIGAEKGLFFGAVPNIKSAFRDAGIKTARLFGLDRTYAPYFSAMFGAAGAGLITSHLLGQHKTLGGLATALSMIVTGYGVLSDESFQQKALSQLQHP